MSVIRWVLVIPASLMAFAIVHAFFLFTLSMSYSHEEAEKFFDAYDMHGMLAAGTYTIFLKNSLSFIAASAAAYKTAPTHKKYTAQVVVIALGGVFLHRFLSIHSVFFTQGVLPAWEVLYRSIFEVASISLGLYVGYHPDKFELF